MKDYFEELGFTNHCYSSNNGDIECISDLKGLFVTITHSVSEVELSTLDGSIKSSINMSYPNKNIPLFLDKLKKHIGDEFK